MGSGNRLKISRAHGIGMGLFFTNMPFAITIDINILVINISIGLGKPYDKR